MYIHIQNAKTLSDRLVNGNHLKMYRQVTRSTIRQMATRLNLKNRSSLLQYECGSKPLSQKIIREFLALTKVSSVNGVLFTKEKLPSDGMINLMVTGEIKLCPCGIWFVTAYSQKQHHSRACQAREWRKRKRKEIGKTIP